MIFQLVIIFLQCTDLLGRHPNHFYQPWEWDHFYEIITDRTYHCAVLVFELEGNGNICPHPQYGEVGSDCHWGSV